MSSLLSRIAKDHVSKAQKILEENGLDGLLVTAADNVRFLTGERLYLQWDWYADAFAAILPKGKEPISVNTSYGRSGIGWTSFPFIPGPLVADRWAEIFARILREEGLAQGRIGLDYMPFATYEALRKELPSAQLVPALDYILKSRAVKSEDEIVLMKEAAKLVDIGQQSAGKASKPGVSEKEAFAKAVAAMIAAGSEGPPFFELCSSGNRGIDENLATSRRLRKGDLIWFDLGSVYEGYVGDESRTWLVGRPRAGSEELYQAVYTALMAGIKAIRPGDHVSEVDYAMRTSLRESGYEDYPHSSGHGVGLKVVELPWVASKEELRDKDMLLQPGMIFALEPKSYKKGLGCVGLEDMILVTESGRRVLTKTRYLDELL
jgi:Xaa-Pro aminopeptidase